MLALCLFGLALMAVAGTLPAGAASKVFRVAVSPQGATLQTGNTVQFSAQAFDKRGHLLPGVSLRWSSSNSNVAQVDNTGSVKAGGLGQARITARSGAKSGSILVTVVGSPVAGGTFVAAGLSKINHVIADADSVYWTEVSKTLKVRKTSTNAGAIFDLFGQPAKDKRGLKYTFADLQQIGGNVYWSRHYVGFYSHWDILTVPKAGGKAAGVLPADVSVDPLIAAGWRASGRFIVVALARPEALNLPKNTRVAAYDTEGGFWSSMVTGRYDAGKIFPFAADDQHVYLRAVTPEGSTSILKATPGAGENTDTVLQTQAGVDQDLLQVGASDGTNLYYWSRQKNGSDRLLSLAVSGGTPQQLLADNFGPGLTTDGVNLYWVKDGTTLVRLPVAGGTLSQLQTGVYGAASAAGVAQNATSLFVAKQSSKTQYSIIRVEK
jgi:hypothetical protein